MKISRSKRFARIEEAIYHCRIEAEKGRLERLINILAYEYGPLMEAIEDDFEGLSEDYARISEQVASFQRAGDEIAGLITALHKQQQEEAAKTHPSS